MLRTFGLILVLAVVTAGAPAFAESTEPSTPTTAAAPAPEPSAAAAKHIGCAASSESITEANAASPAAAHKHERVVTEAAAPKVLFKLNTAEDAPTILRFVTNYLAVEPTAQVAVVGYAGGIDFMLKDARDANGKPYADQLAALTARGVAFKVCNNTLKSRNLTAAAVSPLATVVPGAVNEIIRLQTKEGYAYFQN
jgi:intracellular sulfur oxidation DsrE/DsrF family protein